MNFPLTVTVGWLHRMWIEILSVSFLRTLLTTLLNSLIHSDLREKSNWKGHNYRYNVSDD